MTAVLLLAHLAATWTMVGVIWFVQVVHYPLFASVPRPAFRSYAEGHSTRTTAMIALPWSVEGLTAVALVVSAPGSVPTWVPILGLGLFGLVVVSTLTLQVPAHRWLGAEGFDPRLHRRLVVSNWVRTVAWSARGVLALAMVWRAAPGILVAVGG